MSASIFGLIPRRYGQYAGKRMLKLEESHEEDQREIS